MPCVRRRPPPILRRTTVTDPSRSTNYGDVQVAQGDLPAALRSYRASLAIAERLAKADPGNALLAARPVGVARQDRRRAGGAGRSVGGAHELSGLARNHRSLANADPGNAGWQRDLSVSHDKIGDVQRGAGRSAGGADELPRRRSQFLSAWPRPIRATRVGSAICRSPTTRSATCRWPGRSGRRRSRATGPRSLSGSAWPRPIRATRMAARSVGVARTRSATCRWPRAIWPAALTSYRASLAIAERLAKADPGNAGWQRDLSVSHNKIGDVQMAQGDLAGALTSYRASLAIRERLAKADPGNAGWQRDLSVSHDKIGDVQVSAGRSAGGADELPRLARHRRAPGQGRSGQRGLAARPDRELHETKRCDRRQDVHGARA